MNLFLQLILLALSALTLIFIGLLVWRVVDDVIKAAKQKLSRHNVELTSSGANIGVKKRDREGYIDDVQRQFVSAWNKSSTLGYKGSWLFGPPKSVALDTSKAKKTS